MRVALLGYRGKVGRVLLPALEAAGHEATPIGSQDSVEVRGLDAAIDFTRPDAVFSTVRRCLEHDVPCVVGTTGLGGRELEHLGELARERSLALFVAPNFAIGAVLMIRLAA